MSRTSFLRHLTSITDNELTGTPDWTGAEIAIRKNRWIIDRHIVTNHTATTLTYNALNDYGSNSTYSPTNLNGYFFQNNINCLNGLSDWYYDAAAKKIYSITLLPFTSIILMPIKGYAPFAK